MSETRPLLSALNASPSSPPTHETLGYRLMAISALGNSTSPFFLHLSVGIFAFPIWPAFLIRALLQTFFATFHFLVTPSARASLRAMSFRTAIMLLLRGFIGAVSMALWFVSLKLLPVADASTIVSLHPVIAMLVAYIFLSESITALDVLAAVVSFTGVFLISQPGAGSTGMDISEMHRIGGTLYAIGCAVTAAVSFVMVRAMGMRVNFMSNVLVLGVNYVVLAVAMGAVNELGDIGGNWKGALFTILSALCGFFSQVYTNKGLQHCPVGRGQVIRMGGLALVFLLGIVFLDETPSALSLMGALMVVSAAAMIAWIKTIKQREERDTNAEEDVDIESRRSAQCD